MQVTILILINLVYSFAFNYKLEKNTGIITIATGGYNANNLIRTLKKKGRWKRNIYIYSDPCTPEINNTIILKQKNVTRFPLESKILKMNILKNTTEDYILFLDSDIKVNKPVINFFSQIEEWNESCDVYMPHDMWYSKKFTYNAGIIFVKRNKSERFLNLWKNKILEKSYKGNKDQPALKFIIDNKLAKMCLIPDNLVYYLPDTLHKVSKFNTPLFTHYLKYKNNFNKCHL